MSLRVTHYEASVYHTSTSSSHTSVYEFTNAHANEIGTVLEHDGIPIESAQNLCEKWTRRGNHSDIKYTYRLLTSDKLKEIDHERAKNTTC